MAQIYEVGDWIHWTRRHDNFVEVMQIIRFSGDQVYTDKYPDKSGFCLLSSLQKGYYKDDIRKALDHEIPNRVIDTYLIY